MKIVPILFLAPLLLASPSIAADAYSIIKQRARSAANQPSQPSPAQPASARPVPSAAPVARTASAPAAVTNANPSPVFTAEQDAALKQVIADLNLIKPGTRPTAAQTATVQSNLAALANPAAPLPAGNLEKLAGELAAAWGSQKMTAAEQTRFAKELRRVLNSPASSSDEAQAAVNGTRTLLKYSGVNDIALEKIVESLNAIAVMAKP